MFNIAIHYQYKNQIVKQTQHTSNTISQQSIKRLFGKDLQKDILDVFFPNKKSQPNSSIIEVSYIDSDLERISLVQKQSYYFAEKQSLHQCKQLTIILNSNTQFRFKSKNCLDNFERQQIVKPNVKVKKGETVVKEVFSNKSLKLKGASYLQQLQFCKQILELNNRSIEQKSKTQKINKHLKSEISSNQFQILSIEQILDEQPQKDKNQDSFELLHQPRENQIKQSKEQSQQKDKFHYSNNNQKAQQQWVYIRKQLLDQENFVRFERVDNGYRAFEQRIKKREGKYKNKHKQYNGKHSQAQTK